MLRIFASSNLNLKSAPKFEISVLNTLCSFLVSWTLKIALQEKEFERPTLCCLNCVNNSPIKQCWTSNVRGGGEFRKRKQQFKEYKWLNILPNKLPANCKATCVWEETIVACWRERERDENNALSPKNCLARSWVQKRVLGNWDVQVGPFALKFAALFACVLSRKLFKKKYYHSTN